MIKTRKFLRGFTLLELLVVIFIIGLLASFLIASFSNAQKRARDAKRIADLKALQQAQEQSYSVIGQYPQNCDPSADYLQGGRPVDPLTGEDYLRNCGAATYCVCADLETEKGGNSSALTNNCAGIGQGVEWFCIKNLQ